MSSPQIPFSQIFLAAATKFQILIPFFLEQYLHFFPRITWTTLMSKIPYDTECICQFSFSKAREHYHLRLSYNYSFDLCKISVFHVEIIA